MSMKTKYILVVTVGLLIAVASFIIPRFIFSQPIPTIATNATNADIVNAIYSLHPAISNIHTAINTAMGIQICVMLAVMTVLLSKK